MTTRTRLTLEEFLALPDTEPPSEFVDGEVIQKVAPSFTHGFLTSRIISLLGRYLEGSGEAVVVNEVRHLDRADERVYLPDINVTLTSRLPKERHAWRRGPLEVPPDFAIEVLSPDDRASRVLDKVNFYQRTGVRLIWVFDAEDETVDVYRAGEQPERHSPPDVIEAAPVLPGFTLDLDDLFAALRGEIGEDA